MTRSAPVAVRSAATSATLPRPANSAGSGFLRRAVTMPAMSAPALTANALSSDKRSAGSPSPRSSSTSRARSLPPGRSNIASMRNHAHRRVRRHGDGASWHHGRDRVLVYHLRDRVLEEHHVLVEGFDLSLQFDAVDEVD